MDTETVGLSLSSLPHEIIDAIIERAAEVSSDLPFEGYTGQESDSDEEDPLPPTTQRTLAIMCRLSIQFRTTSQRHLLRHVSLSSRPQMIKWATTGSTAHPTASLEFRDWFEIDGIFLRDFIAKRCTGLRRLLFAVGTRGGGIDEDWLSSPELSGQSPDKGSGRSLISSIRVNVHHLRVPDPSQYRVTLGCLPLSTTHA